MLDGEATPRISVETPAAGAGFRMVRFANPGRLLKAGRKTPWMPGFPATAASRVRSRFWFRVSCSPWFQRDLLVSPVFRRPFRQYSDGWGNRCDTSLTTIIEFSFNQPRDRSLHPTSILAAIAEKYRRIDGEPYERNPRNDRRRRKKQFDHRDCPGRPGDCGGALHRKVWLADANLGRREDVGQPIAVAQFRPPAAAGTDARNFRRTAAQSLRFRSECSVARRA